MVAGAPLHRLCQLLAFLRRGANILLGLPDRLPISFLVTYTRFKLAKQEIPLVPISFAIFNLLFGFSFYFLRFLAFNFSINKSFLFASLLLVFDNLHYLLLFSQLFLLNQSKIFHRVFVGEVVIQLVQV